MKNKNYDFSIFACFSYSYDMHHENKTHLISSAVYSSKYDIHRMVTKKDTYLMDYREYFKKNKRI